MRNKDITILQKKILDFGNKNFRDMPWRETTNPYFILLSEIMLQQTQVDRVAIKYQEFIIAFPTIELLAKAPFQQVLKKWSGLGYNRRALYLHKAAQTICDEYGGRVPSDLDQLDDLPGIGPNTAAAILVYSFNKPEVFIETNIRSVFIHEFFSENENVDDKEILPLIKKTIYIKNPRRWYWALMDYGVYLKKLMKNPSRKSKHYVKQSTFDGSDRQIRGAILRSLLQDSMTSKDLIENFSYPIKQTQKNLDKLLKEGLITHDEKGLYSVSP